MEQPFLPTGYTLIDVHQGELIVRVNDQEVKYGIFDTLEFPDNVKRCNAIKFFGWDYCEEEIINKMFFSEEFDYEFFEGVIKEVNVMADARKFESLDL